MLTGTRLRPLFLVCSSLALLCSCSSDSKTESSKPEAKESTAPKLVDDGTLIPAGELMDDNISFQFAIYYVPKPINDPLPVLNELLANEFKAFKKVEELGKTPEQMLLSARLNPDVQKNYAPPDLDSLRYFGRGLSREQSLALQDSETALILDFGYPKDHVWEGLRSALELTSAFARRTGGLIWDEETREVFTPDQWDEKRVESWSEQFPAIADHTVVHAYSTGEYVRAVTLGMEKFGLPDLVAEEFPWSLNRTIGHVINLFGQAMAEGAVIETKGQFDLDLKTIKNSQVREPQLSSLKSNATAVALLTLRKGEWEEGDPKNRLIEIGFDRYPGNDLHSQQVEMVSTLFGWEDSVAKVKHNEEILVASRRAKAKLQSLRKDFQDGLEPGEIIQVKVPFATPEGGNEWMWVEVTSWKGNKIKGLLKNEPFNIPDLHGGQEVEVSQEDVFDYIRRKPDGSHEGNETGKLIQKFRAEP